MSNADHDEDTHDPHRRRQGNAVAWTALGVGIVALVVAGIALAVTLTTDRGDTVVCNGGSSDGYYDSGRC